MELRQLRCVAAVARQRHFTRAAEDLHVAQSALSYQVRRLEAELGVELFRRTSRSVEVTQAGRLVSEHAGRVLAEIDGLRGELDRLGGVVRGRFTLAGILPLGPVDWAAQLGDFHARYPDVDVNLREGTAEEAFSMLLRDEADAVFAFADVTDLRPGFTGLQVAVEELVAVVAREHRLARRRSVPLTVLGEEPQIGFYPGSVVQETVERALAAAGVVPTLAFESNQLATVRALAARGLGVAILPRWAAAGSGGPPVAVLRISPGRLERPLALVWRASRNLPPAAEAFVEFVREVSARAAPH